MSLTTSTNSSRFITALTVSLCMLFIPPAVAVAGTMTMFDASPNDNIFGWVLSPDLIARGFTTDCQHPEQCEVHMVAPQGFQLLVPPQDVNIVSFQEPGFPGVSVLSDTIQFHFDAASGVVTFTSDDPNAPLPILPNALTIIEDGTVQLAATLTWINPTGESLVDQVFFQSDVEKVPEPATIGLLALGLAGLGFSRRKK